MGGTASNAPGYALEVDEFDPTIDDFVSKERNYVHFDLPLSEQDRTALTYSEQDILTRSFWPLLGFTKSERRAKKSKAGELVVELKDREIKFGSHKDAAFLEWYAKRLGKRYEHYLSKRKIRPCVLAYRAGMGDNISQANNLFDEIAVRKDCTAIALDISGFFDNIRHDELLETLKLVFGGQLPAPDFKIYRRMTRFEWVNSELLEERLGSRIGRRGRLCTTREFRNVVRKPPSLVNRNPQSHGIPQGTPLSGLYANISMIRGDEDILNYVSKLGGSYRRYSDDIAIVIDSSVDVAGLLKFVEDRLIAAGLALSVKKTDICIFGNLGGISRCNKPFQYLGFTFDGVRTLIRQSSLNKYYAKMHAGVRAKVRAARKKRVARDEIYLRELFKRYTHFGRSRNFPRYAYRAARTFGSDDIRHQLRGHMDIFKKALKGALDRAYL